MVNYSNGQSYKPNKKLVPQKKKITNAGNRGMALENDINLSNDFYIQKGIALFSKRPTPINVVKVDYANGIRITDAYFEKHSTTDYNGVYKGKYFDFEAKNTKSKTSFPLSNISSHQILHLKRVKEHGGIAFFIIQFESVQEVYLLDAEYIINFYENKERSSIPYDCIKTNGILIKRSFNPRLKLIDAIEEKYFKIPKI